MVIVLTGPMGCGKTTIGKLLSERLGYRFADGDDFHPEGNIKKMQSGIPLNDEDRLPWLQILHDHILESLNKGENLIMACSALKRHYRKILGIDQQHVISIFLKGSQELLQQRIDSRTHQYMNKGLLASQLATLQEPRSGLTIDIDAKPDEIINRIISGLPRSITESSKS